MIPKASFSVVLKGDQGFYKTVCISRPSNACIKMRVRSLKQPNGRTSLPDPGNVKAWDGSWTSGTFLFDLRERETEWIEENKARLVAIIARDRLGISQEQLEQRLGVLLVLVPSLTSRVASISPDLLAQLLDIPLDSLAERVLALKDIFPQADINAMVGRDPQLLLQTPETTRNAAQALKETLGCEHVDRAVCEQPSMLDVEFVKEVLGEMRRLLPASDAPALLLSDPTWLQRAARGPKRLGAHPDSDLNELI